MSTNHNDDLKRLLADTPQVPEDMYPLIQAGISRQKRIRCMWGALAVCLMLLSGAFTYTTYSSANSQPAYSETQLEAQLLQIHDYLNGNDIDEEYQMYSLLE
ncbi:MAG: hypothetical protein GF398_05225 [Chitinivibrionales bacterium]|nr:hypothetical protein [Chitinivibrionales bacterium]